MESLSAAKRVRAFLCNEIVRDEVIGDGRESLIDVPGGRFPMGSA